MILHWPETNQPDSAYLELAKKVYADQEYGSHWHEQFLTYCKKSKRTLRRWLDGEPLPGPVRAMILAHAKCQKYGVDF